MNDTIRIQGTNNEQSGSTSGRGPAGMDGCFIRPQESSSDESYNDGHIDYTHEI